MTRLLWSGSAALILATSALVAACGSSSGGSHFDNGTGEDGGNGNGATDGGLLGDSTIAPPPLLPDDSGSFNSEAGALAISPSAPTVTVTLGATPSMTPLQFTATYKGATIGAQWTIDRGEL